MGPKGSHGLFQAKWSPIEKSNDDRHDVQQPIDFKTLGTIDMGGQPVQTSDKKRSHKPHAKSPIINRDLLKTSYGSMKIFDSNESNKQPGSGHQPDSEISVSDVIGGFGWFQFLLLLFSGLREGSVGYEAVVMSIILQPEHRFLCSQNYQPQTLADELAKLSINQNQNSSFISPFNETAQCFRYSPDTNESLFSLGEQVRCESWVFPQYEQISSLIASWSLVCHRHWLVAFIESAYFLGLCSGNLVWGYLADRLGRRKAYRIAHTVALVAGWLALISGSNIYLFALMRFFSAFGSISYNIIYSLQVELIGREYRAFSTTLNHLGWGIGVIIIPLIGRVFSDYRYIIGVSPMLALLMYPWAFWLPESCRWLMTQGEFAKARNELIRAAKFNGISITKETEMMISHLADKIRVEQEKKEADSSSISKDIEGNSKNQTQSYQPYKILFSNSRYARDAAILAYVSFTAHLFYYMLTINFAYTDNLSAEANFISSGASEWISVILGATLLRFFSRKSCMSFFLAIVAASFLFQAIVESGLAPNMESSIPVTINNAIGTLSALLTLFISLIVNQEVFPTMIRQTGSSVVNTIGEIGSTISPMLIHLGLIIGPSYSNVLYAAVCIGCSISVAFVTKTDNIELEDT